MNDVTLLLPVAGRSSRYAGMRPKWLLTHPTGNFMLTEAIRGLTPSLFREIVVVALRAHEKEYDFAGNLRAEMAGVYGIDESRIRVTLLANETSSQPETVACGLRQAEVQGKVLIKDSDNFFRLESEYQGNAVAVGDLGSVGAVEAANKSYVAGRREPDKPRRLVIRFLISPAEIRGDASGRVTAVRLVRNELFRGERGGLKSRATEREETVEAGLVFRSVGYRGVPLPGVPFREDWGTVPNELGRVVDSDGAPVPGVYVCGWIKRGPSGVIGTNKPDALETVKAALEDLGGGRHLRPSRPAIGALEPRLRERVAHLVTYEDWIKLDALEVARGKPLGRPRVKFTSREACRNALEG